MTYSKEMTRVFLALTVTGVLALLCANIAEHYFDIAPCQLCLYQRNVYEGMIVCSLVFYLLARRGVIQKFYWGFALQAGFFSSNLGLSIYQVLIEQKIVSLPHICNVATHKAQDFDAFKQSLMMRKIVPCDEITWEFYGLSFASLHVFFSLVMTCVCCLFLIRYYRLEKDLPHVHSA